MPWEEERFEYVVCYRISITGRKMAVLLHGLGGNMNAWDMVARELFKRGFSTLRMELPGHGLSRPIRHRYDFTLERIADSVIKIIRKEKIKNGLLVTHSFSNLLLPFMLDWFDKAIMVSSPYMKSRTLARLSLLADIFKGIGYASLIYERPSTHEYDFSRKHADFDLVNFLRDVFPHHLSTMLFGFTLEIPDFRPLRKKKILVVHGIHDMLVPVSHAVMLSKLIGARLEILEDNHIIPLNSWQGLSEIIARELSQES